MMTESKTGRKPNSGPYKTMIGQRMRAAAEQAGYRTTVAMGEAMGISSPTISRYWLGRQIPSPDEMAFYGRLVGKPAWWFYVETTGEEFDLVAEALLGIVNRVMEGIDVAGAYEQVTGDVRQFGARERAELASGTPPLRAAVIEEAGGDWQRQPPRRRRQVVARLAAKALRGRAE